MKLQTFFFLPKTDRQTDRHKRGLIKWLQHLAELQKKKIDAPINGSEAETE